MSPSDEPPPYAGGDKSQWPLTLTFSQVAGLLNFELADHPVYDGAELQWFDDDVHGTGMLVFLSRRVDKTVDYYIDPHLALDRDGYEIGGGIRSWNPTQFDVSRFAITPDGVTAEVRFSDVEGRSVEIAIDDRDGRPRQRGALLAPVSANIERPTSLMLVWMPSFDLVRKTATEPLIRFDGADARIGRLPGARLHRRHLIKYAGPVLVLEVNREHDGPISALSSDEHYQLTADGRLTSLTADVDGHQAHLVLEAGLPHLDRNVQQASVHGRWRVTIDGVLLTGGSWSTLSSSEEVEIDFVVDQRWRPGALPWLMRIVTTVVPVFRQWPTTYRWCCEVHRAPVPRVTSRWERSSGRGATAYRRLTRS
ncbi:MAG TPA: hypothetical protein VK964_16880 [Nocardioidaceae bacterium]|nr:hypothetical protein [Nocardioidaceae bacterium]